MCPIIQFWHYLPAVSITSPKLKGFSSTRRPHSDASCKFQATSISDWVTIVRGFHGPLCRFNNLLEWLMELRKTLYLHLPVYYKWYNSRTAKWKRWIGQSMGVGGTWSFHALSGAPPSRKVHVFTNLEAQQISLFKSFYRAQSPAATPPYRTLGGAESYNPWIIWSLDDNSHSEAT